MPHARPRAPATGDARAAPATCGHVTPGLLLDAPRCSARWRLRAAAGAACPSAFRPSRSRRAWPSASAAARPSRIARSKGRSPHGFLPAPSPPGLVPAVLRRRRRATSSSFQTRRRLWRLLRASGHRTRPRGRDTSALTQVPRGSAALTLRAWSRAGGRRLLLKLVLLRRARGRLCRASCLSRRMRSWRRFPRSRPRDPGM